MKRIITEITFIFVAAMLLCMCAFAQYDNTYADVLHELGLFSGTDKGYELENDATRVQIAVTFTRLLGQEQKAVAQKNPHPFSDVPSWAGDCIGYLYESYLVNGVSATVFGSNDKATPAQFCTMLLRALGYSDSGSKPDFAYNYAIDYAYTAGLVDSDYCKELKNMKVLKRGDMVRLSYNALKTPMKNSRKTLSQKLCYEQKLLDEQKSVNTGVMEIYGPENLFDGISDLPNSFALSKESYYVKGTMTPALETYGVRLYYSIDGANYVEAKKVPSDDGIYWGMVKTHYEGAAQMLDEFWVFGLSEGKTVKIMLVKTTSNTNMYRYTGKTQPVSIKL
jgi:hypothetical protein